MVIGKRIPLGDLTDVVTKGTTPTSLKKDFVSDGVPFLRINNLDNGIIDYSNILYIDDDTNKLLKRSVIKSGDFLLTIAGTIGKTAIVPDDAPLMNCNQAIAILRVKENLDKDYLKFWLNTTDAQSQIAGAKVTATISNLSLGQIKELKIPLPPLKEQKRIAAILDKADAIRRKRQQAIDLTDQLLRSVFLDMFGDPVTNPKGYKLGKIEDLLSSVNYGTSAKAGEEGAYPILRMNNITYEGGWNFDSLKYIDMTEKNLKKYTAESGDILFNRTNSKELVGKTAVFREAEPYVFAGYLVRSKVNSLAAPEYISSFLNSVYGKRVLRGMCKSIVGMANINAKEYQSIKILIPPIKEQQKYAAIVSKCNDDLTDHKRALQKCDELFLSLTQQAFNGELRKQSKAA